MEEDILDYYNDLASTYDENRFANSYGKYIHKQEIAILTKYLSRSNTEKTLDIACGTGRFLEYANTGIDFSREMVKVSKLKFPEKDISVSNAKALKFPKANFKNAIAFHLFMHLNINDLKSVLTETHRVLEKSGLFIFDIPSEKRRNLTNYKSKGWHGSFHCSTKTLKFLIKNDWSLINYHGVGFFPIHHLPIRLRSFFRKPDSLLANSILKEYSSHLVFILQKK